MNFNLGFLEMLNREAHFARNSGNLNMKYFAGSLTGRERHISHSVLNSH